MCIIVFLGACGIFRPSGAGRGDLTIERYANGYLVRFVAEREVGEAAAFVARNNWLIVTVADSTFQLTGMDKFRSSIVDSVEVTPFPTATQVAFHITRPVSSVEVIRRKPPNEILISVFLKE